MPKLKTRKEIVVDVQEWDALVEETYGRKYSFQQQSGCQNRGTRSLTVPEPKFDERDYVSDNVPEIINHDKMGVTLEKWLARDPKQPLNGLGDPKDHDAGKVTKDQWGIDLWWERNFYPPIEAVANDLHAKGLLDAGEYLINIDW